MLIKDMGYDISRHMLLQWSPVFPGSLTHSRA